MEIKFRDVSSGIVEARASIEILPQVYLMEVTILNKNGQLIVELPQKSFKGKDGRMHHLDLITFENENRETLWKLEILEEYQNWRKKNKKVLVYES
jgi:hypothetical protein